MQILRNGKEKQSNFLGLGDWDSSTSSLKYVLLQSEDSVEKANLQLIINSAPTTEPNIMQYPSRFEWLKAHTKWKLSQSLQDPETESNQKGGNENDPQL